MNIKCSYNEIVQLHKLVDNPKNPNKHPEKQIEMLAKIIDYQGQRSPIVVSRRSGFVVKGHGRLMALRKLGWESAAVDYQDYEDEAQEFADMIADNKIAELAEHDDEMFKLEALNLQLDVNGFDLELLGVPEFNLAKSEDLNSEEMFGDYADRYNGENVQIKLVYEKELWESKKKKVENLINAKGLDDISQLFLWFIDEHN